MSASPPLREPSIEELRQLEESDRIIIAEQLHTLATWARVARECSRFGGEPDRSTSDARRRLSCFFSRIETEIRTNFQFVSEGPK